MKKHNRIVTLALAVGMTMSLLVTGDSAAKPRNSSYSDVPSTASYLYSKRPAKGVHILAFAGKETQTHAAYLTKLGFGKGLAVSTSS